MALAFTFTPCHGSGGDSSIRNSAGEDGDMQGGRKLSAPVFSVDSSDAGLDIDWHVQLNYR